MGLVIGQLQLPKMDGVWITPRIRIIGEPTPRPDLGDNKLACLADVDGLLCVIELSLRMLVDGIKDGRNRTDEIMTATDKHNTKLTW
jgi:hypothetical protein